MDPSQVIFPSGADTGESRMIYLLELILNQLQTGSTFVSINLQFIDGIVLQDSIGEMALSTIINLNFYEDIILVDQMGFTTLDRVSLNDGLTLSDSVSSTLSVVITRAVSDSLSLSDHVTTNPV